MNDDAGQELYAIELAFTERNNQQGKLQHEQGQLLNEAHALFAGACSAKEAHKAMVDWACDNLHISRATVSRYEAYADFSDDPQWVALGVTKAHRALKAMKRGTPPLEAIEAARELSASDFKAEYLGEEKEWKPKERTCSDCPLKG